MYTQNKKNVQSLAAKTNKNNKPRNYGKTRNYKASKRIQMRFAHKYTDKCEVPRGSRFVDVYEMFKNEPKKNIIYDKGFLFVPREVVVVHYDRRNYVLHDSHLIARIFNGLRYVKNLNLDQVVETASLMASVKMLDMIEHLYLSEAWAYYIHNFLCYSRDLSVYNSEIEINDRIAYDYLLDNAERYHVVVPYVIKEDTFSRDEKLERIFGVEQYGIIRDWDVVGVHPPTYDTGIALIVKYKKIGNQKMNDAKTANEMCRVYERYIAGFETERVIVQHNDMFIKRTNPLVYKKCSPDWRHDMLANFVCNIAAGLPIMDDVSIDVPEDSLDEFKNLLYKLGTLRYKEFCGTLECEDFGVDEKPVKCIVPERTADIIEYVKQFKVESEFCREKQVLMMRLAANLGMRQPNNIFYNIHDILLLAMERRETQYDFHVPSPTRQEIYDSIEYTERLHNHSECVRLENTAFNSGPSTSEEEDLRDRNVFQRALDAIKKPINSFKSTMSNVDSASDAITQLTKKLSTNLDSKGFKVMASSFAEFDASSLSSSLSSIKSLSNSLFEQALTWIYEQFGITTTVKIDLSDLIITYILWVNTKSSKVKILIMGYLAMQCGLLDFFFAMIAKMIRGIKQYLTTEDTGFAEEIEKEELALKYKKEKVMKDIKAKAEIANDILEKEPDSEKSTWECVLEGLEKGFPIGLGLGVLGVASAFSVSAVDKPSNLGDRVVKVCRNLSFIVLGLGVLGVASAFSVSAVDKPSNLGDRVVKVCRNLSFIGLGLGAISSIIKHSMGILKVAFDYIKHYVFRSNDTQIARINKVSQFLKNSIYMPGVSNYVFATDSAAAITFLRDFSQIPQIDSFIHKIEDNQLRSLYTQRRREMIQMYGVVKAALQVAIQGAEIFHIQFYSKPGAGKTDLAQNTIKELAKQFKKMRDEFDRERNLPIIPQLDDDSVYFGMESEKYKDLYYGQKYMLIDEMNFFKAEDPESIQFKLGLFSGKPTVANKAALEDKGMLFNLNMVISNTNTAFPEPDDVFCPQALHRRRILVKAEVQPEFLTRDGRIDESKIAQAGINRNLSEHLMFTILDPINSDEVPANPNYKDLDFQQLMKVLKVKVEHHLVTEESRLSNRAGTCSHLRSHIESLITRVEKATINQKPVEDIRKEMVRLARYIEEARNIDFSDPEILQHEFRPMNRLVAVAAKWYANMGKAYDACVGVEGAHANAHKAKECAQYCGTVEFEFEGIKYDINPCPKCHYLDCRQFRTILNDSSLISYYPHIIEDMPELAEEDTVMSGDVHFGRTELKEEVDADGKYFVRLVEGKNYYQPIYDGPVDPLKLSVENFREKDKKGRYKPWRKVAMFEGRIPEDQRERDSLLAVLRELEAMDSDACMKIRINQFRKKQRTKLIQLTYSERIKHYASGIYKIVSNALTKFFTKALDMLCDGLQAGITIFVAVICVWGMLYGVGRLLRGNEEDTLAYNNSIRTNKIGRKLENTSFNVSNDDSNYAKKGQIIICTTDESGTMMKGWINGCCVKGNIFLIPHHLTDVLKKKSKLIVIDPTKILKSNEEGMYEIEVDKEKDIKRIGDKDAALLAIPQIRMFVSLQKKFITEEQLGVDRQNFSSFQSFYQGYRVPKNFNRWKITEFKERMSCNQFVSEILDSRLDYDNMTRFEMSSLGRGPTELGDSGSLVIHTNTKMQSQYLVGMVTQRQEISHQPRGTFITQEDLERALKHFDTREKLEVCHYQGTNISEQHELYNVFDFPENVYNSDKDRSISSGSGFARTPIFGVFPVETEPAIQRADDRRIPEGARHYLKVSLNKSNGQNQPTIAEEERSFMKKALVRHYEQQFSFHIRTLRIYDTLDAVRGTKEFGSVPINIHSSAGLPYSEAPGVRGKMPYIRYDNEQKTYIVQEKILDDVKYYEHLYTTGLIPQNLKLEFVKKELVGPNKIENPKLRTVGTGNLIHQIIYNKIHKSLQLLVKNAWKQNKATSYAMGIDLEQHGDLIVKGLKYTDFMYDFDVKAWESSINLDLLTLASDVKCELIRKAYASRGQRPNYPYEIISQALVVDYTDCDVAFQDVIYSKNSGLLSGHPGTFMENSDIHLMLVYLIARRILIKEGRPGWANAADIYNNVKIIVAADDIVMAISPPFRQHFTPENLKWGYASLGFEITASDKSPEINVKTMEDIQFLKHKFRKDEKGIYHAYPLTSIIYQLLNWYRTDTALGREELLEQNYYDAFRFAYFIGREFYEDMQEKFNRANLNNNFQYTYTYDEMTARIRQDRHDQELLEHSREPQVQEKAQNYYDRFLQ
uniref:Polyprotein n=1 Tax=Elmago virus TaxID=3077879 RepID=A0AA96HAF0_9VIRU|nr:MAG: hypothetical protein [Elmago virus]